MFIKMAFNVFIFFILIEIGWFGKIQQMDHSKHFTSFRRIVDCLIVATLARMIRLAAIMKLQGEIQFYVVDFAICLFYAAVVVVSVYFSEICYFIVNQERKLEIKQKLLIKLPGYVTSVLLLLNPLFHHFLTLESIEKSHVGYFFYVQMVVVILYCVLSFHMIFSNRKFLPKNLIACLIMLTVLWCACFLAILTSGKDEIVLPAFTIGITLLMFALISYDKFWDSRVKMLNKRALYTYLDSCVEKRITSSIYMLRVVGYHGADESQEGNAFTETAILMHEMLQKISPVKNLYYVEQGRVILVIDSRDHVEDNSLLEKLKKSCDRNWEVHGATFSMNVDIYVLHMPEDLKSVSQLKQFLRYNESSVQIRDMEERVHVYAGNQLNVQRALRVKEVENAIQRAIEQKSFQVHYQPIYSVKENGFHSAEALIRLIDPQMGFIPPDEFIPVAEKNGMIIDIGLQVFEMVCQFIHNESIKEYGISYVEVNLSMEQFMDDLLYYKLSSIMEKYEISKEALNLEITETATMYEETKLRRQMKFMSEKGFHFSLDDYGTGYSNMESVIEYPLELVKLDKSIVWSALENKKSFITMNSLIDMFHSLGMKIVAEGVETEEQLQMLTNMGCDYIQGYYFSRPLPKDDFINYVTAKGQKNSSITE